MNSHKTGTREEWLAARLALVQAEKELTRQGDEVSRQRRELPWVRVDKSYSFETDKGTASLADLFRFGCEPFTLGECSLLGRDIGWWPWRSINRTATRATRLTVLLVGTLVLAVRLTGVPVVLVRRRGRRHPARTLHALPGMPSTAPPWMPRTVRTLSTGHTRK